MARGRSKVDARVAEVLAKRPWDEDDARAALKAFDDSGMNQAGFARKYGFSRERLSWWRKKLEGRRGGEASMPALLPVQVVEPASAMPVHGDAWARGGGGSGVEVVVRGARRVRVDRGFDAETLYRVVEILEVAPC